MQWLQVQHSAFLKKYLLTGFFASFFPRTNYDLRIISLCSIVGGAAIALSLISLFFFILYSSTWHVSPTQSAILFRVQSSSTPSFEIEILLEHAARNTPIFNTHFPLELLLTTLGRKWLVQTLALSLPDYLRDHFCFPDWLLAPVLQFDMFSHYCASCDIGHLCSCVLFLLAWKTQRRVLLCCR